MWALAVEGHAAGCQHRQPTSTARPLRACLPHPPPLPTPTLCVPTRSHHPLQRPALPPEARPAGRAEPVHAAGRRVQGRAWWLVGGAWGPAEDAWRAPTHDRPAHRPLTAPTCIPLHHHPPVQTFQLSRAAPLPPQLLPYLRVVFATRAEQVAAVTFGEQAAPVAADHERTVLNQVWHAWCLGWVHDRRRALSSGSACCSGEPSSNATARRDPPALLQTPPRIAHRPLAPPPPPTPQPAADQPPAAAALAVPFVH